MEKSRCSNMESYSSPVPIIGLYVAGASLVCLILMLWDIFVGLRRKTRYTPCQFFSINSTTLTLLSIASKLPVDLTTYMPSARDQLSKLTGTTMICICIGFIMPSLATNRGSESITNMVALTIFFVTIIVNICIQLATGVIFSFIIEHIIILCCMMMLMFVLWFSTLEINRMKVVLTDTNRFLFFETAESFMYRVKRWYIYSCVYNPQFVWCRYFPGLAGTVICMICSLVLSQAAFRSLVLRNVEFCEGISDYGWSMWMIVITQIVTIIIGSVAIGFRWFTLVQNFNYMDGDFMKFDREDFTLQFTFMKRRSIKTSIMVFSQLALKFGLCVIFAVIYYIFASVPLTISVSLFKCVKSTLFSRRKISKDVSLSSWKLDEFALNGFDSEETLPRWMIKNCVKDMNKWILMNIKRDNAPCYMAKLMQSRPRPSTTILLNKFQSIGLELSRKGSYKVTCLSMVLLVKIVMVSVPSVMTELLRHTLDEAFKIIYYIDEKINVGGSEYSRKRQLAKFLWASGDIHLGKIDMTKFGAAVLNVDKKFEKFKENLIKSEMKVINDFICIGEYTSIEDLCGDIEQLFADMLQLFLTQLPTSILKEVNEGPIEDCEERARTVTKFLCELVPSLEDKVQWSFPKGANITLLMDSQDHDANAQEKTLVEDVGSSSQEVFGTTHDLEELG